MGGDVESADESEGALLPLLAPSSAQSSTGQPVVPIAPPAVPLPPPAVPPAAPSAVPPAAPSAGLGGEGGRTGNPRVVDPRSSHGVATAPPSLLLPLAARLTEQEHARAAQEAPGGDGYCQAVTSAAAGGSLDSTRAEQGDFDFMMDWQPQQLAHSQAASITTTAAAGLASSGITSPATGTSPAITSAEQVEQAVRAEMERAATQYADREKWATLPEDAPAWAERKRAEREPAWMLVVSAKLLKSVGCYSMPNGDYVNMFTMTLHAPLEETLGGKGGLTSKLRATPRLYNYLIDQRKM